MEYSCVCRTGSTGNGLDQREWFGIERRIWIPKPRSGDRLVASDDRVERSIEGDEQNREFERLQPR